VVFGTSKFGQCEFWKAALVPYLQKIFEYAIANFSANAQNMVQYISMAPASASNEQLYGARRQRE
jgi:hypothetical protein